MRQARRIVLVLIAFALIESVVHTYTFQPFYFAMHRQTLAGGVLASLLAGIVFLLAGVARQQRLLRAREKRVLLVLLLPQWLSLSLEPPYIASLSWLHPTRWGVAFLLMIAGPLWLGLLAALGLISIEVPRAVVAAGIAGIGAACLVFPVEAYFVIPNQIPVLLMHLLLDIAIVFTYVYACPRIVSAGTLVVAGSYLLLSGLGGAVSSFLLERRMWEAVDLREAAAPFLVQTVVTAGATWLWFWLLKHMPLPAFTMLPLATWTGATFGNFLYGSFFNWRVDVSFAIAVAAIAVALRARAADEQPVALGLHSP